jgi:hypothetical protein
MEINVTDMESSILETGKYKLEPEKLYCIHISNPRSENIIFSTPSIISLQLLQPHPIVSLQLLQPHPIVR